jgi:predicted O-methyltransferase YrrM
MGRLGRALQRLSPKALFQTFPTIVEPPVVWGTKGFEWWTFLSLLLLHSKCTRLLELGSGRSTITLAEYAKFSGAQLTSLETDAHWFKKTQVDLRNTGLSPKRVLLIDWNRDKNWYAVNQFRKQTREGFDFAYVDGPNNVQGRSLGIRDSPVALLEIRSRIAGADVVVVDDVHRRHVLQGVDPMLSDPSQYERWFYRYKVIEQYPNALCLCIRRDSLAMNQIERIVSVTGIPWCADFRAEDCPED